MGGMKTHRPIPFEDVRMFLAIKIGIAPKGLIRALAKPSTPALEREKATDDLVEFMTRDMKRWSFARPVDDTPYMSGR